MNDLAEGYKESPYLEENDAKGVRHFFEKDYRKTILSDLSSIKREILFRAMEITALRLPRKNSWFYWIHHYDELSTKERLIILDVLGYTALSKKNVTKSKNFVKLQSFFEEKEKLLNNKRESERAGYWIQKLIGEVRPE